MSRGPTLAAAPRIALEPVAAHERLPTRSSRFATAPPSHMISVGHCLTRRRARVLAANPNPILTPTKTRGKKAREFFRRDDQHELPSCVPECRAAELSSFRARARNHLGPPIVHRVCDALLAVVLDRGSGNGEPDLRFRFPKQFASRLELKRTAVGDPFARIESPHRAP